MTTGMIPIVGLNSLIIFVLWRFALGVNPSSMLFRAMERVCAAAACLYAWNLITPSKALTLALNPLTVTAAGLLGVPGIAVMAAIRALQ